MTDGEKRSMTIVVGVELDDTGDDALLQAAELARASDAHLHLVYACGDPASDPARNDELLSAGASRLHAWAISRIQGDPLVSRCSAHVDLGRPDEVIVQLAVDLQADLIVVGSHRKGLLERLREGSVVRRVLTDAPCAVLVALPRDYEERTVSPQIQPPPKEGEHKRAALKRPRRYSYRMSNEPPGQSTVGPGRP